MPLDRTERKRYNLTAGEIAADIVAKATEVPYGGTDRELLDAMCADARRRGMDVEFFQAVEGKGMARTIVVIDPSLPEKFMRQVYKVPPGYSWRDGLGELGIIKWKRPNLLGLPEHTIATFDVTPDNRPAIIHVQAMYSNHNDYEAGAVVKTYLDGENLEDDYPQSKRSQAIWAGSSASISHSMSIAMLGEVSLTTTVADGIEIDKAWCEVKVDQPGNAQRQITHRFEMGQGLVASF